MSYVTINRDGSVSLTWLDARDAWQVGDVLMSYGAKHNDVGFKDDGRALMAAADEVELRRLAAEEEATS